MDVDTYLDFVSLFVVSTVVLLLTPFLLAAYTYGVVATYARSRSRNS